jgi:Glycosyl hydrolase family 30 beta sandwich domain
VGGLSSRCSSVMMKKRSAEPGHSMPRRAEPGRLGPTAVDAWHGATPMNRPGRSQPRKAYRREAEGDLTEAHFYLWGANTSTTTITGPNTGLVEVKGNTTVATSGRLWAFASYSRFIRPGAVRIGTTTSATGLDVSAFRNSDGSIAVVALNTTSSRQVATFSLRRFSAAHVTPYLTDTTHELSAQTPITVKNSAFTATLPPRSLVSYDIRP